MSIKSFSCLLVCCEVIATEKVIFTHKYSLELNCFQSQTCLFMNFTSCLYNQSSQLCPVVLSLFSETRCLELKTWQKQMTTVSSITIHPDVVPFTRQYGVSMKKGNCLQLVNKNLIYSHHSRLGWKKSKRSLTGPSISLPNAPHWHSDVYLSKLLLNQLMEIDGGSTAQLACLLTCKAPFLFSIFKNGFRDDILI